MNFFIYFNSADSQRTKLNESLFNSMQVFIVQFFEYAKALNLLIKYSLCVLDKQLNKIKKGLHYQSVLTCLNIC